MDGHVPDDQNGQPASASYFDAKLCGDYYNRLLGRNDQIGE